MSGIIKWVVRLAGLCSMISLFLMIFSVTPYQTNVLVVSVLGLFLWMTSEIDYKKKNSSN